MKARVFARVVLALGLAGLLLWVGWNWLQPPASLDPIARLVDAGRTDEAETQLRKLVARDPGNARGQLLLANLALKRLDRLDRVDEPLARDALEHVRRVPTDDHERGVEARIVEAKLCDRLGRYDETERALKAAIERDPTSEAGWLLLGLYETQARRREGHALALRLYRLNPKPDGKRSALIELVRESVHQPAAAGLITALTPVVRANPADFQSRLALGRALAKEGRSDEGLPLLRAAVADRPEDVAGWRALLTALEDAGKIDELQSALAKAKAAVHDDDALARFDGWISQGRSDWKNAVAAYQRALQFDPRDMKVAYRLSRALRLAGDDAEAARAEQRVRDYDAARKELRRVFETHEAELRDAQPHPAIFQQVANLRERMGCPEEARGWHAMVLRANPSDPVSLAAVERLK